MARRILIACPLLLLALLQVGCLKRTISITTEPEGALVWLNDVQVGRTPLETDFTYYGTFDVRIHREGYEPIVTKAKANEPVQEMPGLDLVGEAMPVNLHTMIHWNWVLTPLPATPDQKAQAERRLIDRAQDLREISSGHTGSKISVSDKDSAAQKPHNPKPAAP